MPPESPPKRVTRARARATADTKTTKKPTIITTPAAKATRPTKRKTRADEEDEQPPVFSVPPIAAKKPDLTKSSRGRAKKPATTTEKQTTAADEKIVAESDIAPEPAAEAPKARGRPKKVAVPVSKAATRVPKKEETAPTRKVTRSRNPINPPAATTAKNPAPKKTVTWAAEATLTTWEQKIPAGKENVVPLRRNAREVASLGGKGAAVDKPTGLRAKPVRKPAATRATKRGKDAKVEETTKEDEKKAKPLSPKKATQVAVSNPIDSDEDELAEPKTPTKALSRSPVKMPISAAPGSVKKTINSELSTSIDEIQLPFAEIKSPTKAHASSILASPARRPVLTPFKNGLKGSPKKPLFGDVSVQQMLIAPTSPTKSSLRESPKRINLGDSILRSTSKPPNSSFKASLLQSPARRAAQTPRNLAAPNSPGKSGIVVPITDPSTPSQQVNKFSMPTFSPLKNVTSPFRAAKSPERSVKVHKMTPKEQQEMANHDWLKSPFPLSLGFGTTPATTAKSSTPGPIEAQMTPVTGLQASENALNTPTFSQVTSAVSQEALHPSPSPSVPETCHVKQPLTDQSPISSTTPVGLPPSQLIERSAVCTPVIQRSSVTQTSKDELQSDHNNNSPMTVGHFDEGMNDSVDQATPTPAWITRTPNVVLTTKKEQQDDPVTAVKSSAFPDAENAIEMTPLALQFGNWQVTSPDKKIPNRHPAQGRGIFSPVLSRQTLESSHELTAITKPSPAKSTFFEDEMSVRDQTDSLADDMEDSMEDELVSMPPTETSTAGEEYGDENTIPIDPALLAANFVLPESNATCTPAKVFSKSPQVVHTVSKIPLKAAAEETPSRLAIQRRQSVAGPFGSRASNDLVEFDKTRIGVPRSHGKALLSSKLSSDLITKNLSTPIKATNISLATPSFDQWSVAATPLTTPRRAVDSQTLKGAVVHVDVHTTEGADASGIFIELLTQMGARCVKQWTWNPNASNNDTGTEKPSTPSGKIGITHVVFKDGSKRTLEKVRKSNGVVLCVGVGWVLDCERDNKWLDENEYAVDTALVPRGGHRRRKSMEPRALLSNLNNPSSSSSSSSLAPTTLEEGGGDNMTPAHDDDDATNTGLDLSPTKEFLTFDTPADRRASFLIQRPSCPRATTSSLLQTPCTAVNRQGLTRCGIAGDEEKTPTNDYTYQKDNKSGVDVDVEDEDDVYSPTTPYYLSKGARLIQMSCPRVGGGGGDGGDGRGRGLLFPISGVIDDQPDADVRRRLVLARRKSLQFAPKVGSPLSRGVSWGG